MTDKEIAIDTVTRFLRDKSKRILLVKGYDNDAKIRVILSCLNDEFKYGIIRTSSMSDISFHIYRAFNKKILPHAVKSTQVYRIENMEVNISSYISGTKNNPDGNVDTFTWYHPVQTVLDNEKKYSKFLDDMRNSQSRKIIISTTNEWSIDNWDIENHVDQVFFYDVENDNPDIMRNLRNNGAI